VESSLFVCSSDPSFIPFSTPQTLLVDGYISQTFRSRAAEQYFLKLLESTSIPPLATLPSPGGGCFFFVYPVPPHIAARFPRPPGRCLLDRGIIIRGTVVPQKMWFPQSAIGVRQYVERAELQMPVFFEGRDRGLGLSLEASVNSRRHVLRDANDPAPLGPRTTTHIRIAVSMVGLWSLPEFEFVDHQHQWPGYKTFKRQIPIRDETSKRKPITMAKFVGQVGRTVDKFLQVRLRTLSCNVVLRFTFQACELDSECADDPGKLWRIGPAGIQRSNIVIIGAVHISAGSWMAIMQLNRYIF
jgi:hypothetical protein